MEQVRRLSPSDSAFVKWARWFSDSVALRTISPFSRISTRSYVVRRTFDGTSESLEKALDLEPNNPMALVKYARLQANAEHADFLSRLAETYAPLDPNVLWFRAQVLQQVFKMTEAYEVMQRAVALDERNWKSFTSNGTQIKVQNKSGFYSEGWLPSGWTDNNAALAVSVSYKQVQDLPENTSIGFGINVAHGSSELLGPRFVCKRNGRYTIEGWVRSALKSDLTVALCEFISSNDKLKEQTIRTTPEWRRFRIQFTPPQDTAAELRIYQGEGASVDVAGITLKEE
jgi:hypothetical protein